MGDLRVTGNITIDPGHYDGCPNVGYSGEYNEGTYNSIFAAGVIEKLKTVKAYVTRRGTNNPSLTARGKMAALYGNDFFISIHSDAVANPSVGGCTVYYSVDIPDDKALAEELGQAVADAYGVNFRGAKVKESTNEPGEDYYTVMDASQDAGARHVFLIERAFHSNPTEEQKLLDPVLNTKAEEATAAFIEKHFGEVQIMERNLVKKVEKLGESGFVTLETIID
jgi:N-acetylmuramoyl-L-alanine amidase